MRTAIVVGSGAAGATIAKELQGAYDVTVLEAGRPYRRCELDHRSIGRLARSRLLVDPRLIRVAYPTMRVRRTRDMLVVHGSGTGGTTTVATGNGIRAVTLGVTPGCGEDGAPRPVTRYAKRRMSSTCSCKPSLRKNRIPTT